MRFSSKSRAACFYCISLDLLICIIFYVDQITCRCWGRQSANTRHTKPKSGASNLHGAGASNLQDNTVAAGVLQVDGIIPCISVAVQAYRLRLVSRVRIPGQEAACRRAVVSRAQVLVSRQGIGVLPAVQVWVREIGLCTTPFFYTPI